MWNRILLPGAARNEIVQGRRAELLKSDGKESRHMQILTIRIPDLRLDMSLQRQLTAFLQMNKRFSKKSKHLHKQLT
jgi:hypothetical protein